MRSTQVDKQVRWAFYGVSTAKGQRKRERKVVRDGTGFHDSHASEHQGRQAIQGSPRVIGWSNSFVPEPLLIDGPDSYEVEAMLAERVHKRKRQVLVK